MKAIVVITVQVNHHLKHEKIQHPTLVIMVDMNTTEERVRVIARMNPPSHLVIVTPKVDVYIIPMYNYDEREE